MDKKFDGDVLHLKMLLALESIEEITKLLSRKEYYVDDSGNLYYSNSNDIIDAVFKFLS